MQIGHERCIYSGANSRTLTRPPQPRNSYRLTVRVQVQFQRGLPGAASNAISSVLTLTGASCSRNHGGFCSRQQFE